MKKIWTVSKIIAFNCVLSLALILMVEGLSSSILIVSDLRAKKGDLSLAEPLHTRYDKDLGWINIPNKNIPNMYGPGANVTINSQSMRNSYNFDVAVPKNKIRFICSGDSFTFGYGVDNDDTWCSLLTRRNNRIESINMGQPAYGLDQIYLRYMRDGSKFDHDVHIVAFIGGDFDRMFNHNILGYNKPVLSFEEGRLVVKNTPVPKTSGWLNKRTYALDNLKTKQLLSGWFSRNRDVEVKNPMDVVTKVFMNLNEANLSKKSSLVLVYLPTREDFVDKFVVLRSDIAQMSKDNNWTFVDLTDDFKKIPSDMAELFFIQEGQIAYSYGAGHYTREGNRYVSRLLYDRLSRLPDIKAKLIR